MSERLTVCSEIFTENEQTSDNPLNCVNEVDTVTHFKFKINNSDTVQIDLEETLNIDEDGDFILERKVTDGILKIEHSKCTVLDLVGLQVWRGALLLADFVSHFGNKLFCDKTVIELGCGVGLTGIVAALYSKHVIFSDIDTGGILNTVESNVNNNRHLIKSNVQIQKIDFYDRNYSENIEQLFNTVDILLAADVIYDNDLTEEFVKTLIKITENRPSKTVYISLEKRYVFAVSCLNVVAPCYEYFVTYLQTVQNKYALCWKVEQLHIDFPTYFDYTRSKDLVLLKITT